MSLVVTLLSPRRSSMKLITVGFLRVSCHDWGTSVEKNVNIVHMQGWEVINITWNAPISCYKTKIFIFYLFLMQRGACLRIHVQTECSSSGGCHWQTFHSDCTRRQEATTKLSLSGGFKYAGKKLETILAAFKYRLQLYQICVSDLN